MAGNVGTCTFVLTDIEGSTPLWFNSPEQMRQAMSLHNRVIEQTLHDFQDRLFVPYKNTGDGVFATFSSAEQAYHAAKRLRLAFEQAQWADGFALKIRIALHSGDTENIANDVQSVAPAHAARLLSIGHGGQTLVSPSAYALLHHHLQDGDNLISLGSHLIRDWGDQETPVYQLNLAALPSLTFPPLRTQYPNNLPLRLSEFVGKTKEKQKLLEALRSHRLVTLTGIGGSGKTRLALETAQSLCDRREFKDGVYFVGLETLPAAQLPGQEEVGLVMGVVVRELRITETQDVSEFERLQRALQSKTLLLVLDNCEHRIAECTHLVNELLACCPNIFLLATSRERLKVQGECLHEIKGLTLPQNRTAVTLAEAQDSEAVHLFAKRAQLVAPDFTLTEQNIGAVAAICRTLDGIPFAIELAAAYVQILGVKEIEKRLFSLLDNQSRPHHDRQRTLWTTLQWSLDLLTKPEPKPEYGLLLRLAMFAGGWTLEAAEDVCAGEEIDSGAVLNLMHSLISKSLVWVEDTAHGKRYRLPEIVRNYLHKNLLTETHKEVFGQKHRHYFLELVERAEPELTGLRRKERLAELIAEQDNLRLIFHSGSPLDRLRLMGASWRLWAALSLAEAKTLLTTVLRESGGLPDHLVAKAHSGLGAVLFQQGHYTDAESALTKSLRMRKRLRDKAGQAETLLHLGNNALAMLQFDKAAPYLEQCLTFRRALNDHQGIAAVLNSLGSLAWNQNNLEQAREFWTESRDLHHRIGDQPRAALLGSNLALISFNLNEYTIARSLYEENMQTLEQGGNRWEFSQVLNNYAETCYQLGDYETACSTAKRNFTLLKEIGSDSALAYPLETLGKIRKVSGDHRSALLLIASAAALCEGEKLPKNLVNEIAALRDHFELSDWERLWRQGQGLSVEKLTELALSTNCSTA